MKLPRRRLLVLCTAALAATGAIAPAQASRIDGRGHVYTSTNGGAGNAVLVFGRDVGGGLTLLQTAATGGNGNGSTAGLGSQGAVTLSGDRQYLFVVNVASNSVSTFALMKSGSLHLVSTVPSGGNGPISVAERSGIVYVLNSGVGATIAGFRNTGGTLVPLADGIRTLSDDSIDVGPAQVSFDRLGRTVLVTEKNTNLLDTWKARPDGTLDDMEVTASAGATPFGFAFDGADHVVVSEAAGGPDGSGASSYAFPGNQPHTPVVVTASLGTGQKAACWVAITPDSRIAFTANAASGSISAFGIGSDGTLVLQQAAAETTAGSHPLDTVVSPTGKRVFNLDTGLGDIATYSIGGSGKLWLKSTVGVPLTAAGLAIE